jgi:hypothetical protein
VTFSLISTLEVTQEQVKSRLPRLVLQMALNKKHPGEAGLSLPSCHGTFISKCPPVISCLHLTVL